MPKINGCGQAAVLSRQEMARLFRAMSSKNHRLIFAICRYTTERISAVLALEPLDVYDTKGKVRPIITFRGVNRKGSKGKPGKTRQIPTHPRLRELLDGYEVPQGSKWLFPNSSDPTKHITRQAVDEGLRRACEKAGLGDAGVSTHTFRRTAITELANSGVNIRVIQEVTGHASLAQLKSYIEVSEKQVKEAINLL